MVISNFTRNTNKDACVSVRAKILQAAQERLWHYGFKKTTIDEIAADAGIGKGTVYLHFSSKEEIALEIVAQFKKQSIAEVRIIASDCSLPLLTRIKEMLLQPILVSHARCSQSPAAIEILTSVRPNLHEHLKQYVQQEQEILAEVLQEGNSLGLFSIDDTGATARTLKSMCAGFWQPFPYVTGEQAIRDAISEIVDLAFNGFKAETKRTNE